MRNATRILTKAVGAGSRKLKAELGPAWLQIASLMTGLSAVLRILLWPAMIDMPTVRPFRLEAEAKSYPIPSAEHLHVRQRLAGVFASSMPGLTLPGSQTSLSVRWQ